MQYDVAIVGAGPAGTTFARELKKTRPELSVVLIDGQTPERKKPCGGLLAPDAQKVLAQFDLTLPKDILADPQIFAVETMDLVERCTRYYQRHYLNMDRWRFDRWLLSLVPPEMDVISDRVVDIIRENGFRIMLRGGEISARYVVGADGGGSLVRRRLWGRLPQQYVSIQEWYVSPGKRVPWYSCIFDRETSDSCSWTIHKDGFVIFGGAFRREGCREAFARQKTRLEAYTGTCLGQPLRREACLVTSPRRFGDLVCGGADWFLLGEAAGLISASSFEGISSAMESGRLLAKAFEKEDILKVYRRSTLTLRWKLTAKMVKRAVLCSPLLRKIIMKSGLCSVKLQGAP